MIKLLYRNGNKDSIEPRDGCGTTPLMDALRAGHVSVARFLIDHKLANYESIDDTGRSALHLSAEVSC